ncbi:MAG: aminopeptidase [Clostridiaceae bacterium]
MPNLNTFAKTIVDYSCSVQPGENVLILAEGLEAKPRVLELVREIYRAGANPFFDLLDTDIQKAFISGCNERQMEVYSEFSLQKLKQMQSLIVISALESPDKYADIPLQQMSLFYNYYMQRCFYAYGVMNTKWIYLKYPTKGMAKLFGQSQEIFEDYYFSVCTLDYGKLSIAMDQLVALFQKTDRVRIVSKGTDLSFSIRGIAAEKSDGKNGLPDGEVFTAPVRDSANGVIQFNCPLYFRGQLLEDIRLVFENGKVVEASANDTARLNQILDLDENARYLGEFALSVNNRITKPMKDILFDEKIGGSLHLALGNAYITTDNGNHSSIHMDIVQIQRPEFGGGEVWFDDVLIRKDGKFVFESLAELDALL